jgi:hypothetical protein
MLKVALDSDPIVDKIMYDVVGMDEDVSIVVMAMVITCVRGLTFNVGVSR